MSKSEKWARVRGEQEWKVSKSKRWARVRGEQEMLKIKEWKIENENFGEKIVQTSLLAGLCIVCWLFAIVAEGHHTNVVKDFFY